MPLALPHVCPVSGEIFKHSRSDRLHVEIFRLFSSESKNIPHIPLEMTGDFREDLNFNRFSDQGDFWA